MKNNKGFSLVELIVVIAIMAILAAVAIPTFASFITKANVASDEQFIADLEYSIELANTVFGKDAALTEITAEDGTISAVKYTVGDVEVTIDVTNSTVTCNDAEIKEAAADVIATMDWTYTFKSAGYKSGYTPATEGTTTDAA